MGFRSTGKYRHRQHFYGKSTDEKKQNAKFGDLLTEIDTNKVFIYSGEEWVDFTYLVTDITLLEAKDFSGAISNIPTEHRMIHLNRSYFIENFVSIPTNETYSLIFKTDDKKAHLVFNVASEDTGYIFRMYKGINSEDAGEQITVRQNNGLDVGSECTTVRLITSAINKDNAELIKQNRRGTIGGTSQRNGGGLERSKELVLDANTEYLFEVENVGNVENTINFEFDWYEV